VTPYYSDDLVTIYHGDCREVLAELGTLAVDLVLTDPPYGINFVSYKGKRVHGDDEPFDPSWMVRDYQRLVIFGANYFAHLLPPGGWLIWSKRQDNRDLGQWAIAKSSTAEVAWTNVHRRVEVYNYFWGGGPFLRSPEERGNTSHPTLKPVSLMRWILGLASKQGDLILDPYMGSGPVARAAMDTGRRYIGIEIEERYCEIAANRCSQEVLGLAL
jgi:site-specific DNA-methyltransferase (adenine-specific)